MSPPRPAVLRSTEYHYTVPLGTGGCQWSAIGEPGPDCAIREARRSLYLVEPVTVRRHTPHRVRRNAHACGARWRRCGVASALRSSAQRQSRPVRRGSGSTEQGGGHLLRVPSAQRHLAPSPVNSPRCTGRLTSGGAVPVPDGCEWPAEGRIGVHPLTRQWGPRYRFTSVALLCRTIGPMPCVGRRGRILPMRRTHRDASGVRGPGRP